MKKFLSILLALAVGFTFTFGSAMSAFAAEPTYGEKLVQAQESVLTELEASYNGAAALVTDNATLGIDKAAYVKTLDDVYADYKDVVAEATTILATEPNPTNNKDKTVIELKALIATTAATSTALSGKKYEDVQGASKFAEKAMSDAYKAKALSYQFPVKKDAVKAEINKIDLNKYSDNVANSSDPFKKTWNQLATEKKAELLATAEEIVIAANASESEITTAVSALNAIISTNLTAIYDENDATKIVDYKINGLKTKDDEGLADQTLETKKLAKKSEVNAVAAKFYTAALAAGLSKTDLAKQSAYKDAYLETQLYLVDIAENDTDLNKVNLVSFVYGNPSAANFATFVEAYNEVAAYADIVKKTTDKTGSLIYDTEKIDKNLKTVKATIYDHTSASAVTESEIKTYKDAVIAGAGITTTDLDWAKKTAVAGLEKTLKNLLYDANGDDKYYALEKDGITKAYNDVIEKINAATTIAQVNALKAASIDITKYNKIKTAVEGNIKSLPKFNGEYNKVKAYLDYLNTGAKTEEQRPISEADLKTKLAKLYAEKGARTDAEIIALITDAQAMVEALPTNAQIKASKNTVDDMIKALPSTITLADKAAVKAAYEAREELPTGTVLLYGSKLDNAIDAVKNLEKKAIDEQFKALPKVNNITAADKTAVKAAADAVEAYEKEAMYNNATYSTYDIDKYVAAVKASELAALIAQIAALPDNPTAADKAVVEAARAAYDAYVAEYTDYEAPYDARNDVINDAKLFTAEATVAADDKLTAEEAKAYVQDLSIAVRTAKVGKKVKVTVNADVQTLVDNGYTVTYKFYKSTKKSSGYKNTVNKTTNTYTNTNPVKGKNYYKVKLVVKNADGAVVTTTPLTQCKYGVRTIK